MLRKYTIKKTCMKKGFTLLEVLLVVGIIAILAGIVIVAINPTKQLGDARNAQRRSDVLTILNAVYQYAIDNNGNLPDTADISTASVCNQSQAATQEIATTTGGTPAIYEALVGDSATYLTAIPTDPGGNATTSGYHIKKDATTGRVTVCAPLAEQSATISVTR